jgi:ribonucleoside-diphosphate reductase alpha chain
LEKRGGGIMESAGISTATVGSNAKTEGDALRERPVRHRLPDERSSITHKFNVGGHEGYITVGLYPDGQPGELFITMAKGGSTVSGLISSFAQTISIALQHGIPL